MAQCDKCLTTDVRWVRMQSGHWNLLDSAPSATGNIVVIPGGSGEKNDFHGIHANTHERAKYVAAKTPLYTSHFLTCRESSVRKKINERRARRQERQEQQKAQGSLI